MTLDYPNVDHVAFTGQHSSFSNFEDRQSSLFPDLSSTFIPSDTHLYPSLSSVISILSRIAVAGPKSALLLALAVAKRHPEPVQIIQICEMVPLHRSTISKNVVELSKLNILKQHILEGTENRHKPTYLYTLGAGISDKDVIGFCSSHNISLSSGLDNNSFSEDSSESLDDSDEEAAVASMGKTSNENFVTDTRDSVEDGVDKISDSVISASRSSFEKRMETVLTQMATEIVKLRKRVALLEEELKHRSQETGEVDLEQVVSILQSLE